MNRAYWDDLAENYDEQIFSVLRSDDTGQIAECILEHANSTHTAADLGCGPGQITPLLATNFGHVHACDISRGLLESARVNCRDHSNVEFHRYDLANSQPPIFDPVDFVVCVNVLLTADLETRERLWERVTSLVGHDGTLLLVVPSHESALYTNFRRLDSHVRSGSSGADAVHLGLDRVGHVPQLEQGVRGIEGVKTKHFLREEIMVQLADRSLQVEHISKITYDWSTEFADPPDWLGSPHPWNWLVVAKR
jgi:SAM-dependent methyltransferase